MQISDIPTKFPIPFADQAGGSFVRTIPEDSQIGINDGWASLQTGFPPLNFVAKAAGGVPPFGQDWNGLFKQITQWSQWQNAGAAVQHDAGFATSIGGYPQGALLFAESADHFWLSEVDDNLTDPDAAGAGWLYWPPRVLFEPTDSATETLTYTDAMLGQMLLRSFAGPMVDTLPGTVDGVLTNKGQIAVTNDTGAFLMVIQAGSGTSLDGVATGKIYLGPGQTAVIQSDGSNYYSVSKPDRARLAQNTSLYIATSGGSNSANSGLTAGSPWATIQFASDFIAKNIDGNNSAVVVNLAAGTYAGLAAEISYTGFLSVQGVTFQGGTGVPSDVVVSALLPFKANACGFIIKDLSVLSSGNGILAQNGGYIGVNNVTFLACTQSSMLAQLGGWIEVLANWTFAGSCFAHAHASSGGYIVAQGHTCTVAGGPTVGASGGFAVGNVGGILDFSNALFAGTGVNGRKYLAALNGVIVTGTSGNVNFFPGTSAGATATGGQYD